jgi:hypothetical protein
MYALPIQATHFDGGLGSALLGAARVRYLRVRREGGRCLGLEPVPRLFGLAALEPFTRVAAVAVGLGGAVAATAEDSTSCLGHRATGRVAEPQFAAKLE